ncbi:sulfonate transport system substrate-binding protein [Paraburkholderia atlantica]|uniref:Sulfonate transport system substrate-binding protein n=1 Tax=Paraburkholderia atlantica TaxID=2654982 RepID=A0A7W8Q613_PARAM|nr:ABC transporter substrate-binding protein [Paraburkholderia atlantica]MBB5423974.1 sulfonate transport system substrate-binding protein [Paraburkholderia atlantica]
MSLKKSLFAGVAALLATFTLASSGTAHAQSQQADLKNAKLVIAYQDPAFPALIRKSGVVDGTPYQIEWVLLTGPAANLSALYAGRIDLGHMGDTSLTIEQANARTDWTKDSTPLRIVAGWRNAYSKDYPPEITALRTSSGITSVQAIKGHKFGYNYGGYNHAQYLATLVKAGLSEKDVQPIKFADGATSAAGFNAGQVDVYSGALGPVLPTIRSGAGHVLLSDRDTKIPALNVWTTTSANLKDPAKVAALQDFFSRMSGYWSWHDAHKDEVIGILKDTLKISDERAAFEYQVRSGSFVKFDKGLLGEEQNIADILYDGHAIRKKVKVDVEYDPRFNAAQKAIWPIPSRD